MKLYATITSERASKAQGGRELLMHFRDENRNVFAVMQVKCSQTNKKSIRLWMQDTGWVRSEYYQAGEPYSISIVEDSNIPAKGEKQKGEKSCNHNRINTICEVCGMVL